MKLFLVLVVVLAVGCVYPTTYTKHVTVEKDKDGDIIKIIEFEGVIQQAESPPIFRFDHLKTIQPPEKEKSKGTPAY